MTTSGTYLFELQVFEMLIEAWERCQKDLEGLNGPKLRSAKRSMSLMLNSDWPTRGINLWKVIQQGPVPLAVAQVAFGTFRGVIDVIDMQITRQGVVTKMEPMGREDFNNIPNPNQRGRPSVYWIERTLPYPTIHFWPASENATDTINYWPMLQLQDVTTFTQTVDTPVIFQEAVVSGLAARMAEKWVTDPQLRSELKETSKQRFATAFGQDTERAPLTLQPDAGDWGWNR